MIQRVDSNLGHTILLGSIKHVVQQLQQRASSDYVAIDQIGKEPKRVAGIVPLTILQRIFEVPNHVLYKLNKNIGC
jgi:hypothetical protein